MKTKEKNLSFIAASKKQKYFLTTLRIPIELANKLERTFLCLRQLAIDNEELKNISKACIIQIGIENIITQINENKNEVKDLIKILRL